jgi:hypothetical protein
MKFEKAFVAFRAFLETLSVAMTAANSTNPVVNFFRCNQIRSGSHSEDLPPNCSLNTPWLFMQICKFFRENLFGHHKNDVVQT